MRIEDLDFHLPKKLIAQEPVHPRDNARLLVYKRSDNSITDAIFHDLPDYLTPATTVVRNRAKVDKARLLFGKLEVFILDSFNDRTVKAMVRPGKKFKTGEVVNLSKNISARVIDIDENGYRTLEFSDSLDSEDIKRHQHVPLPPYIQQNDELAEDYQTVYAKDYGSKAAPTAGLHFTESLLAKINASWPIVDVTLNVGLGTFAPIDENDIKVKKLHQETYSISRQSAEQLNKATHITAIGTTTARLLESAYNDGFSAVENGSTDIFIQPGDKLHAVDSLITNFHLPSTSLLMMVAAFTGSEELIRIYNHAIDKEYRFYSFGDAMIVV